LNPVHAWFYEGKLIYKGVFSGQREAKDVSLILFSWPSAETKRKTKTRVRACILFMESSLLIIDDEL